MCMFIRKRFIAITCYLVAVIMLLSPVAHASFMMDNHESDRHSNVTVDQGHAGHQQSFDLVNVELKLPVVPPLEVDFHFSSNCELTCSVISVSDSDQQTGLNLNNANDWLDHDSATLKTSFLTLLDKPPRT